jgi:hypothetical protein
MKKTTTASKKAARIRFEPDYTITNRGPRAEIVDAMFQADIAAVFARCPVDSDLTPDTFDEATDVVCLDCRRGVCRAIDSFNSHRVRRMIEEQRERLDPDAFADFIREEHELEVEIAMDSAKGYGLPPLDLVRDSVSVQLVKMELDALPKQAGGSKGKAKHPKTKTVVLSKDHAERAGDIARDEFKLHEDDNVGALGRLLRGVAPDEPLQFHFVGDQQGFARVLVDLRSRGVFNGWPNDAALHRWAAKHFVTGSAERWEPIGTGFDRQIREAKKYAAHSGPLSVRVRK